MSDLYYSELMDYQNSLKSSLSSMHGKLENMYGVLSKLLGDSSYQGETADAIKAYIQQVHMGLISQYLLVIENLEKTFDTYIANYTSVDKGGYSFKLSEEDYQALITNINSFSSSYNDIVTSALSAMGEVEDITVPPTMSSLANTAYTNFPNHIDALPQKITPQRANWENFDSGYTGYFQPILDLVQQLNSKTRSYGNGHSPSMGNYTSGNFTNSMSQGYLDLLGENEYINGAFSSLSVEANSILQQIRSDEQDSKNDRIAGNRFNGALGFVFGGLTAITGGIMIGSSGGAATPIVLGGGMALFGGFDAAGGINQVVTGTDEGDNPLRSGAENLTKNIGLGSQFGGDLYDGADIAVGLAGADEADALKLGEKYVAFGKVSSALDKPSDVYAGKTVSNDLGLTSAVIGNFSQSSPVVSSSGTIGKLGSQNTTSLYTGGFLGQQSLFVTPSATQLMEQSDGNALFSKVTSIHDSNGKLQVYPVVGGRH